MRKQIIITREVAETGGKITRSLTLTDSDFEHHKKFVTITKDEFQNRSITVTAEEVTRSVELNNLNRQSVVLSPDDFPTPFTIVITTDDVDSYKEQQKALRQSITLTDSDFVGQFSDINYHGTRSEENVQKILRDGWMVGNGNGMGSGIYFAFGSPTVEAKNTVASGYSGGGGAILTARVAWGNYISLGELGNNQDYIKFCSEGGSGNSSHRYGGDAITEWCLANGYDSVVSTAYGVLLQPQYAHSGQYWKTPRIQIVEIYYDKEGRIETVAI